MTAARTSGVFPCNLPPLSSFLTEPQFRTRIHSSLHVLWRRWAGAPASSRHSCQLVSLSVSMWSASGPWDRKSAGGRRGRFSSLRKKSYVGSSAHCGPSSSHLSSIKGASPSISCCTGRKAGGACALAGMMEPSFLGISGYVKIVKLAWFGIFSYLQKKDIWLMPRLSILSLDSPVPHGSLNIACRGLAMLCRDSLFICQYYNWLQALWE